MNIEEKVRMKLFARGFSKETILNNRGLVGATVEETIVELMKELKLGKNGSIISRCYEQIKKLICQIRPCTN